jgi:hypothetical protein
MRKIRDVLRLRFESGLSDSERVIARSLSLSNGSVNAYLLRVRMAGPCPRISTTGALERLLFPPTAPPEAARAHRTPDWAAVDKEMRRKGVTLALLWAVGGVSSRASGRVWLQLVLPALRRVQERPTMRQS